MLKMSTPWLLDVLKEIEMDEMVFQMRLAAANLAVQALKDTDIEAGDITKLANEIFAFLNGETK